MEAKTKQQKVDEIVYNLFFNRQNRDVIFMILQDGGFNGKELMALCSINKGMQSICNEKYAWRNTWLFYIGQFDYNTAYNPDKNEFVNFVSHYLVDRLTDNFGQIMYSHTFTLLGPYFNFRVVVRRKNLEDGKVYFKAIEPWKKNKEYLEDVEALEKIGLTPGKEVYLFLHDAPRAVYRMLMKGWSIDRSDDEIPRVLLHEKY